MRMKDKQKNENLFFVRRSKMKLIIFLEPEYRKSEKAKRKQKL